MTERPQNVVRRNIDGKEYSCAKLPYSKSREMQFSMQGLLVSMASQVSNGKTDDEIVALLPAILISQASHSTITKLCETCFVDGDKVNVDSFNPDEGIDLKVAALALETHFLNFTKTLSGALGEVIK